MTSGQRRSIRLKSHNYGGFGTYFLTICTFRREPTLSAIDQGENVLSALGTQVSHAWNSLAERYSYVDLDISIVMPNHVHGIITIHDDVAQVRPKPLGQLVAVFKMTATQHVRQYLQNPEYVLWQRNYCERVIRDEAELNATRHYIVNNPLKWADDENYYAV